MADHVTVDWDDLFDLILDADNPRHEAGMQRRDIIEYLVAKESVLSLAKDIAEHGLSPLEDFGGVRNEDGDIVIVEGNRRLCALILMYDASLAPAGERKAFEHLGGLIDTGSLDIEVVIFKDRAEANLWIERKHQGFANGIGPRPWNATQKARHFGAQTGNTLALALLEYAVEQGIITEAERERGIITTVTRFVSNPYVRRQGLGIETGRDDPAVEFAGSKALFRRRLQRLLRDILQGANGATSRTDKKAREDYAHDFLVPLDTAAGRATSGSQGGGSGTQDSGTSNSGGEANEGDESADEDPEEAESVPDDVDGEQESAGTTGPGTPANPDPGKRPKLLSAAFNPEFMDLKLQRILHELRHVGKATPMSAALMVRVLLESMVVSYLGAHTIEKISENDKLHILMHKVLNDIDAKRKSGQAQMSKSEASSLQGLKVEVSNASYVYSAGYLGRVAHGGAFPEWTTLTARWDEIEPIVLYLANHCE